MPPVPLAVVTNYVVDRYAESDREIRPVMPR